MDAASVSATSYSTVLLLLLLLLHQAQLRTGCSSPSREAICLKAKMMPQPGACWILSSLYIHMDTDSLGSAHLAALKAQGPMDSLCAQLSPTPGSTVQPPACILLQQFRDMLHSIPDPLSLWSKQTLGAGSSP